MSNKDQIILTDAEKSQLDELSKQYADVCDQFNTVKAKKMLLMVLLRVCLILMVLVNTFHLMMCHCL